MALENPYANQFKYEVPVSSRVDAAEAALVHYYSRAHPEMKLSELTTDVRLRMMDELREELKHLESRLISVGKKEANDLRLSAERIEGEISWRVK
jgi:hypothetical protein